MWQKSTNVQLVFSADFAENEWEITLDAQGIIDLFQFIRSRACKWLYKTSLTPKTSHTRTQHLSTKKLHDGHAQFNLNRKDYHVEKTLEFDRNRIPFTLTYNWRVIFASSKSKCETCHLSLQERLDYLFPDEIFMITLPWSKNWCYMLWLNSSLILKRQDSWTKNNQNTK
jgi:hypothetical protein